MADYPALYQYTKDLLASMIKSAYDYPVLSDERTLSSLVDFLWILQQNEQVAQTEPRHFKVMCERTLGSEAKVKVGQDGGRVRVLKVGK